MLVSLTIHDLQMHLLPCNCWTSLPHCPHEQTFSSVFNFYLPALLWASALDLPLKLNKWRPSNRNFPSLSQHFPNICIFTFQGQISVFPYSLSSFLTIYFLLTEPWFWRYGGRYGSVLANSYQFTSQLRVVMYHCFLPVRCKRKLLHGYPNINIHS